MKDFLGNLKHQKSVIIAAIITIVLITIVGFIAFDELNKKEVTAVGANTRNLGLEEEKVPVVKEQVIQVSQDTTIDEALKSTDVVEFQGKKVEMPKSKVAAPKSKEDPENTKKKGGGAVNQSDTASLFENTGVKSYGIDVSSWQGNINWAAVKASGVDFAIIRAGYRGYGSGAVLEDSYFKQNVKNATANGVKVGVYFYSAAVNETEALEEAIWIVKKISTYGITYPVVYDCEEIGVPGHRTEGVSGAQAANNANTFLNFVKSNGYEPMLYANKSDIGKMGRGNFSCKFWLAHYTSAGQPTDYKGSHQMWQYTSEGTVPGINGKVDMNVAYFSYGATANAKHTHNFSEVVRNSHKDPTCTTDGEETLKCSCGETETKILPKTGHKFGAWQVRTPATEENEGLQFRKCTNKGCNYEETKKIDKIKPNTNQENPGTNTNTNTNTNSDVNNNSVNNLDDDNKLKECEHKWVWIIDKNPTCKDKGIKHQECSKCQKTQAENTEIDINPDAHTYGEWQPSLEEGKEERVCQTCGNVETRDKTTE